MFNIGPGELMAIAAVALIVLGPQRLPQALRSVGRVVGELRKISGGFQDELRRAIDDTTADPDADSVGDVTEGRPSASGPAATATATSATSDATAGKASDLADDDEPEGMLLPADTPEPDLAEAEAPDQVEAQGEEAEPEPDPVDAEPADQVEADGADADGTDAAGGQRAVS